MRTTSMPPHLTAQTLATQPSSRPQAAPTASAAQDGFEALALKSASPSKIIVPKQIQQRAAETVTAPERPQNLQSAIDELARRSRPGSKLDIRV